MLTSRTKVSKDSELLEKHIKSFFFFFSISRTSRKNTFQEERSGNLEKEGNVSSRKLVLGPMSLDPGAPKAEA